jgi:hypothetical protein
MSNAGEMSLIEQQHITTWLTRSFALHDGLISSRLSQCFFTKSIFNGHDIKPIIAAQYAQLLARQASQDISNAHRKLNAVSAASDVSAAHLPSQSHLEVHSQSFFQLPTDINLQSHPMQGTNKPNKSKKSASSCKSKSDVGSPAEVPPHLVFKLIEYIKASLLLKQLGPQTELSSLTTDQAHDLVQTWLATAFSNTEFMQQRKK